MIITRTPFRISFFGGGTDYPSYYREHGGAVFSTSINKYCYITCRYLPPFFDHKFRVRYTQREETDTIAQIRHPSVRACLRFMGVDDGVEVLHTSDIPAMSGIGSSSAFTVGLLHALYALKGRIVTKRQLAFDAIHVEQELIGEAVGSQDQTVAAFGGMNRIDFGGPEHVFVQPVTAGAEVLDALQRRLMFYFTGFSRRASDIAREQIRVTAARRNELARMREMVDEAVDIVSRGVNTLDEFGALLHDSWQLKRSLSERVSTADIDAMYATAKGAGALGGKLCGAGGGGFMLLYVPEERQQRVREALKDLLLVPIRFDTLGSHVAFYSQ